MRVVFLTHRAQCIDWNPFVRDQTPRRHEGYEPQQNLASRNHEDSQWRNHQREVGKTVFRLFLVSPRDFSAKDDLRQNRRCLAEFLGPDLRRVPSLLDSGPPITRILRDFGDFFAGFVGQPANDRCRTAQKQWNPTKYRFEEGRDAPHRLHLSNRLV